MIRHFFSREFLVFLLCGGTAAVASVLLGWLLYRGEQRLLPYSVAVWIGAFAAILVNFSLNYLFNFRYRERSAFAQFRTFAVVATGGVFLTSLCAWAFHGVFALCGLSSLALGGYSVTAKFAAHVLAVGVVTLYSFLAHKFLSFNAGITAWVKKRYGLSKHSRDRHDEIC